MNGTSTNEGNVRAVRKNLLTAREDAAVRQMPDASLKGRGSIAEMAIGSFPS